MNCPITFLDWDNKTKLVSTSSSSFLEFSWKKVKCSFQSVAVLIVVISLYCNETIKFDCFFTMLLRKTLKNQFSRTQKGSKILYKINQQILNPAKNNRDNSKALQLVCSWLARICWRLFTSCFIYGFAIQVTSEKTLCSKAIKKRFYSQIARYFWMKIIANIIPTNLVVNLLLSLFCPAWETKNKNQVLSKLTFW